jgi:hypothetical protein
MRESLGIEWGGNRRQMKRLVVDEMSCELIFYTGRLRQMWCCQESHHGRHYGGVSLARRDYRSRGRPEHSDGQTSIMRPRCVLAVVGAARFLMAIAIAWPAWRRMTRIDSSLGSCSLDVAITRPTSPGFTISACLRPCSNHTSLSANAGTGIRYMRWFR